jgi:hypothetical protein
MTHERMFPIFMTYVIPMNKTAGKKIIMQILLPGFFLVVIPFLYFIVYLLLIKTCLVRCICKGLFGCCADKDSVNKNGKAEAEPAS